MVLVGEALNATSQSFKNQINIRNNALTQAGRLLSGDFAFKTAYASGSTATIESALDNHRQRIGANLMLLLSLEGDLVAATGSQTDKFSDTKGNIPFPDLIEQALNDGEASGMVSVESAIYSVIAVPLLTPVPSAWIVLGFEVDENLIRQLQEESHAEVSIFTKADESWRTNLSTMPIETLSELIILLNQYYPGADLTFNLTINQNDYFTYISQLPSFGNELIYSVLQRASSDALAPYYRIRLFLIALLLAALIVSFAAGGVIASSVTKPVLALVRFARQIQRGEYENEIKVEQKDELGQLANAFNDMSKGLYERDKVRNLLGKVISPEIAEELISKDVQLGGEERDMTILFTDLRNFTGLSEKRSPAEVLNLLNEYLTLMTGIIDKHGGVVDKYIGDAIMALFGAPLVLPDHAEKAVNCAMEMTSALNKLNIEFTRKGLPELAMGIGVNTGNVVVGNMGSRDRLNYTVIGDNVNLASRLESVTKDYQVSIIVSENTRHLSANIKFRKLDRITVKGKQEPVTIYTPTNHE